MRFRYVEPAIALGVALAIAAPAMAQRPPVEHIRGVVTAAEMSALTVRDLKGATVTIVLPQKLRVSGLAKSSLADVKKGTYLGTTAVPGPGDSLIAKELHLFPDRMRGVGEGHRPWDLTPDSTMTNGSVDIVVDQVKGRQLTLSFKGGMKKVMVPQDAAVVSIVKATRDELKPGAKVFVVARKGQGGKLSAVRVSIGKAGLMPPM